MRRRIIFAALTALTIAAVPDEGQNKELMQWMQDIQNSASEDGQPATVLLQSTHSSPPLPPRLVGSLQNEEHAHASTQAHSQTRFRRMASQRQRAHTCSLFIRTDPTLWQHVSKRMSEHKNLSVSSDIHTRVRQEILSIISHHVAALNYIYHGTKFDGKVEHRGLGFEVQRVQIDSTYTCASYFHEPNPFCVEDMTAKDVLETHSLENHEDYCLAYLFTYRDLGTYTPGISWRADATGRSGGLCERYKTYTEVTDGQYRSRKMSLNTGVLSLASYGSPVPAAVSQLNLARLVGHSFGSKDDDNECQTGGPQGNFIMFRGATPGDRPNNSRYSPCSISDIGAVLDAIDDGLKRNCFTVSSGSFCGNRIVEPGEECDCGFNEIECQDRCCYPRQVSEFDRDRNSTAKGCSRRANTQCSPSQGPCCNEWTCLLRAADTRTTCREATECKQAAYCRGTSPECAEPAAKADHTACNHGTQMCIKGECSGSMCLAWNMTQCFLNSPSSVEDDPNKRADGFVTESNKAAVTDKTATEANKATDEIEPSAQCTLACRTEAEGPCRSTAALALTLGLPAGGVRLPPGAPCRDFQGYCDRSLVCRVSPAPRKEGQSLVPTKTPVVTS